MCIRDSANTDRGTDGRDENNSINRNSGATSGQSQSNKETTSDNEDILIEEYEGMLGSSGDEGEGGGYLNPNINYNEVTDEEPSEGSSDENDSDEDFSGSEENLSLIHI